MPQRGSRHKLLGYSRGAERAGLHSESNRHEGSENGSTTSLQLTAPTTNLTLAYDSAVLSIYFFKFLYRKNIPLVTGAYSKSSTFLMRYMIDLNCFSHALGWVRKLTGSEYCNNIRLALGYPLHTSGHEKSQLHDFQFPLVSQVLLNNSARCVHDIQSFCLA